MIDVLYKLYFVFTKKPYDENKDLISRILSYVIRKTVPVYYNITGCFVGSGLNKKKRLHHTVVSLTSHPARIALVWLSVESILRQTYQPDKIILWLAKEQFSGISELPVSLKKLVGRGLTIEFSDDLKSHKKYLFSLKEYPDSVVITVDDDFIFPYDTIECLYNFHEKYPHSVICHGARENRICRKITLHQIHTLAKLVRK